MTDPNPDIDLSALTNIPPPAPNPSGSSGVDPDDLPPAHPVEEEPDDDAGYVEEGDEEEQGR
ncbi:MAG: hypothetical protein J2P16_00285 [Mycobacterium sp.]|nr:hypothetical protein [Mycobacterium sp.]